MNKEADNKTDLTQEAHWSATHRILGVYPQRQSGLFMQRIKIPGGRMSWPQWRKVARLAAIYSHGFPLHITTRQDIELHNIVLDDIPAVQRGIAEVGLITFGACGDSVRNITVCAGCDLCEHGFDLLPLAVFIRHNLEQRPIILNLPRKFKISFSGCHKACARPWLNDLGFIAQDDALFTVIGAGSLGFKPSLGIELYKDLPADDVLPVCIAAIEFFEQFGDRENRRRARFRHIRERFGDRGFRKELDARFNRLRKEESWPDFLPARGNNKDLKLLYRLQLPNGNINPEEAIELADFAESKGIVMRINLEHGLEFYGTEIIQLPNSLVAFVNNPPIVTCPGRLTCPRGLADCWATAEDIRRALTSWHLEGVCINISGCSNNCAHSVVADIGLVGLLRRENGRQKKCYRLFTGGGNGRNNKLAKQSCIVDARDVVNAIKNLLK